MLRCFILIILFFSFSAFSQNEKEYPIPTNSIGKIVKDDKAENYYIVIKNNQTSSFLVHRISPGSMPKEKLAALEGKFVYADGMVKVTDTSEGKTDEVFMPYRLQEISLGTVDQQTLKEIQKEFDLSPKKAGPSSGFGINDKVANGITGGIGLALIWSLGPIGILPAGFFGYLIWRNNNAK